MHADREDDHRSVGAALRVLLAAHGYEPPGWGAAACRVVARFGGATVRVLAVIDVPCPAFTALTPRAARAYREARATWMRDGEVRLQGVIAEISPFLSRGAAVVRVPAIQGDLARTIAEYVSEWPADIAVIGAPQPGLRRWMWPGPVHERVLRRLPCAVMVVPPPAATSDLRSRRATAPRAFRPWRRPAAASHGA
jgi:nucleotide-binding universal stress UspA family protein